MKKILAAFVLLALAIVTTNSLTRAADEDKPVTTKEVMKRALKGPLAKKVATGKASDGEKKELLELFLAMSRNDPPQGDADSWKAKNAALVQAARGMIKGDEGAGDALTKAANCKNCHSKHKPST